MSGCNFAGTTLAVGSAVKRLVYSTVMGMNLWEPPVGSFATYVGAPGDFVLTLSFKLYVRDGICHS